MKYPTVDGKTMGVFERLKLCERIIERLAYLNEDMDKQVAALPAEHVVEQQFKAAAQSMVDEYRKLLFL